MFLTFGRKYPNKFGILLTYSYLCSVESEEPDGVPHFSLIKLMQMIDKNLVESVVNEWLTGKDYFLVDVTISADDCIVVTIDHAEGVWIEDCAELSRFIESRLDRDAEDYELEVGSAGLGQPFRVRRQYEIHVGRPVETQTKDGHKYQGMLKEVSDDGFTIEVETKVKPEGAKRPHKELVGMHFTFDEVAYTKYLIKVK